MKKILFALSIAFYSLTAYSTVVEEPVVKEAPKTKEVCYDKNGAPVSKGTKGANCKTIRIHKKYDGVKIPPEKK